MLVVVVVVVIWFSATPATKEKQHKLKVAAGLI